MLPGRTVVVPALVKICISCARVLSLNRLTFIDGLPSHFFVMHSDFIVYSACGQISAAIILHSCFRSHVTKSWPCFIIAQCAVGVVDFLVQRAIFIEGSESGYFRVHTFSGKDLVV